MKKPEVKKLIRYYIPDNDEKKDDISYKNAQFEDYYSVFNDFAPAYKTKKEYRTEIYERLNSYNPLRIQAIGLVICLILLTAGFLSSFFSSKIFFYDILTEQTKDTNFPSVIDIVEYEKEKDINYSAKYRIDYIKKENTSLRNGNELISLFMAFSKYSDREIMDEAIKKYLNKAQMPNIYNNILIGSDPRKIFIGDPYGEAYGFFADGLYDFAQKINENYNLSCTVENISGQGEKLLFEYLNRTIPVVVWYIEDFEETDWNTVSWHFSNGIIYHYPANIKAALALGYNGFTITLFDPDIGIVEYNKDNFIKSWKSCGPDKQTSGQAVAIK